MATMSGGANLGVPGTSQASSGILAHRKKDSSPSARFWESPDTLAQLDVVRQWMGKHYKKYVLVDAPSCQALAAVTLQLLQFQEDAFGRQATNPALTKLPAQCFLDLRPGGGLCHILGTAYKFKVEQGWWVVNLLCLYHFILVSLTKLCCICRCLLITVPSLFPSDLHTGEGLTCRIHQELRGMWRCLVRLKKH
uniref:Chromo domain-containing protein n=1 Tax=Stegastes partitus TaxID=144197 RepID=A0A3B4ZIF3_9TELE